MKEASKDWVHDVNVRPATSHQHRHNTDKEHVSAYFQQNWKKNLSQKQNYFNWGFANLQTDTERVDYMDLFLSKWHFSHSQANLTLFEASNQFHKVDILLRNKIVSGFVLTRADQLFTLLKFCNLLKRGTKHLNGGLLTPDMVYPHGLDYDHVDSTRTDHERTSKKTLRYASKRIEMRQQTQSRCEITPKRTVS